MDPFVEIESLTGLAVPLNVIAACIGPKLVHIPAGRVLYSAGPFDKPSMQWGAFEEGDLEWYQRGNQLDPTWYRRPGLPAAEMYEFSITLSAPVPAVMSKVADIAGVAPRLGPSKFQYYNPAGLGVPARGRVLGSW
jgi:hypothetical protein